MTWELVASVGTFVFTGTTFFAALVALIFAKRQIHSSREMEAINAYEKYHHLVLEYPEYGCGYFNYQAADQRERRRYAIFVLSMLLTIERIIILFPRDHEWRAACLDDLALHTEFLQSKDFSQHRAAIDQSVLRLIEESRSRPSLVISTRNTTTSDS